MRPSSLRGSGAKISPRWASTPVRPGADDGALVDVGGHHLCARSGREQGHGQGPGPGAEIDRRTAAGQALGGAAGQLLAVGTGYVDAGIDADFQAAESRPPRDPGEWLAAEATFNEPVEELGIAARPGEQQPRLILRRQKPGLREPRGQRFLIVRRLHPRN